MERPVLARRGRRGPGLSCSGRPPRRAAPGSRRTWTGPSAARTPPIAGTEARCLAVPLAGSSRQQKLLVPERLGTGQRSCVTTPSLARLHMAAAGRRK